MGLHNGDKMMRYEEWSKLARKASKKSLWMVHFCTGCGAVEMPPVMTSRYDAERFGITSMATPRQADVLLITGYLTVKTLRRVIQVYEQMQSPKYVIAFGSCTINGGMYWDSYNTIKHLEKYIPVDLYIAGCMPRPEGIINAFIKLMKLIDEGKARGWEKYQKYYDRYKENQRRVFNFEIKEEQKEEKNEEH